MSSHLNLGALGPTPSFYHQISCQRKKNSQDKDCQFDWWLITKDKSQRISKPLEMLPMMLGFLGGSLVKNLPANARGAGSIPEWGRSPGAGNGLTLQYPCLENSMDGGAWRATVHLVSKGRIQLSNWAHPCRLGLSHLSFFHHVMNTNVLWAEPEGWVWVYPIIEMFGTETQKRLAAWPHF